MLTQYQMKKYAEKFLMDTYGLELIVPLEINGRLKTTCGRFIYYRTSRKPKVVEMNKFFVQNNSDNVVLDVLRHELVHYALFMKGLPHSDGQPTFERELKRLGIVSQSTIDKYDITSKKRNIYRNIYTCAIANCGKEYATGRALKNEGINHRCACGGKLISKGRKLVAVV